MWLASGLDVVVDVKLSPDAASAAVSTGDAVLLRLLLRLLLAMLIPPLDGLPGPEPPASAIPTALLLLPSIDCS